MRFIEMTKEALRALKIAQKDKASMLDMQDFIVRGEEHPCGTAACVIGYTMIHQDKENTAFPIDTDSGNAFVEAWGRAARMLEWMSRNVYFNEILISIYMDTSFSRHESAESSGLFTDEELESFKHLHEDNSSIEDAIIYLEAILSKLDSM